MEIKVVINRCYGGFSLSSEALSYMALHAPELDCTFGGDRDIPRDHPVLVRCVEELGSERASGVHAKLKVVTLYYEISIDDHDGMERAGIYWDGGES